MKKLFTSESVTEGHPDKLCDKIADSILDEILKGDPNSRVACEVCCTTGMVLVMGEITTEQYVDMAEVARRAIKEVGYDKPEYGFDYRSCAVLVAIDEQSPDISMGVSNSLEHKGGGDEFDLYGAGDQGLMFGYASNETKELMPLAITLAHALTKRLAEVRKAGTLPYLRPDGKAQVTLEYENNKATRVDAVVVSTQHSDTVDIEKLRKDILKHIINEVLPKELVDKNTKVYINPTGRFVLGGPMGDSGLTGRKIIVDTYGGYAPHGGGSFSGKDPTKVDRSATYYARYVAKNIVSAGLAERCELQVAYAIGKAQPVSVCVNTFGTGIVNDEIIAEKIKTVFDFRPASIIKTLNLRTPIYSKTSNYGHFGNPDFPWEKTDKVSELKKLFN
ncbi:MAG: methionine adenosyltransferase [Firmicutes bacterium]|nr:methionine adenosyltransferase [Bacillota bacterium]